MLDLIPLIKGMKPGNILLIQACIVILIPYLLWRVMQLSRWLPLGVVQILTGVLLGPGIFGAAFPDLFKALFGVADIVKAGQVVATVNRADAISAIATIAVCLFGFLAGADADKKVIANSGPSIASIGIIGMLMGWGVSSLAGYGVYHMLPQSHLPQTPQFAFVLAFGLVMAVSALPVLALILRDLDFTRKRIGAVALASSGIADTVMWIGLAVVVALSFVGGSVLKGLGAAFLGGFLSYGLCRWIAGPMLENLLDKKAPEAAVMTLTVLTIFTASAITSITDLHPVLGAFVAGMFLPDRIRELAAHKLDQPTTLVLMPFFFLNTGLRTQFSLGDIDIWILFAISTVLCVFGKMIGHGLAARMTGETWPFSFAVGMLLQTKGLMEIIVISVFYERGIVSPLMFSAAVLMCMISTALPTIILRPATLKYGDALTEGNKPEMPTVVVAPQSTTAPVLARLEFEDDRDPISITTPTIVIGRHTSDDIRLEDVRISRGHIRLTIEKNGRANLQNQTADRSVANPVTVNGEYREQAELKDGDKIGVGGMIITYREALDAAVRRAQPA